MSPVLARRQAALAAVALLAALAAIALERISTDESPAVSPPPPAVTADWEDAVAGIIGSRQYGSKTACEVVLDRETRGVAHPVLPCGVDLLLQFEGKEVRAEVVARGPFGAAAREFDLTQALADDLGVEGTTTIRWRFAG